MMKNSSQTKWNSVYQSLNIGDLAPSLVLSENAYLLPEQGRALDVACGLGGNAVLLAQRGLSVDAWDISDVAVTKLNTYAEANRLAIQAVVKDLAQAYMQCFNTSVYDVIMVCHYLDRALMPHLIKALKPGGFLLYQTFVQDVTSDYKGPSDLLYRLAKNELLQFFSSLQLVMYRENALHGTLRCGLRNEAMIIVCKN